MGEFTKPIGSTLSAPSRRTLIEEDCRRWLLGASSYIPHRMEEIHLPIFKECCADPAWDVSKALLDIMRNRVCFKFSQAQAEISLTPLRGLTGMLPEMYAQRYSASYNKVFVSFSHLRLRRLIPDLLLLYQKFSPMTPLTTTTAPPAGHAAQRIHSENNLPDERQEDVGYTASPLDDRIQPNLGHTDNDFVPLSFLASRWAAPAVAQDLDGASGYSTNFRKHSDRAGTAQQDCLSVNQIAAARNRRLAASENQFRSTSEGLTSGSNPTPEHKGQALPGRSRAHTR